MRGFVSTVFSQKKLFFLTLKVEMKLVDNGRFVSVHHPSASEATREVANLTERKNLHTSVYGVKEFDCLSICDNIKPHLKLLLLIPISHKVSKGLWYLGKSHRIYVKDWIKDPFTAHSLLLPFEC